MNNIFETLEELSAILIEKSKASRTKAATSAYLDASNLLTNEINRITTQIKNDADYKLEQQMKKFDTDHANYDIIKERGHIGIPNEVHAEISQYTMGEKDATEVFDNLSTDYKETILTHVAADKEMIEQLVAYRHGFEYITHTKGHDGIKSDGTVFEVKNKKYTKKAKRLEPNIIFDRVSPTTARKLDEGRPIIIFNITAGSKLLVEYKINFSDKLITLYNKKVEELKYSKTSGFSIPFTEYKDDIIEVTYIDKDISDYHIQKQLIEYLESVSC